MALVGTRTKAYPQRTPLFLRAGYPWLVTITVVLGSMMAWTDANTMNVVLPRLMAHFALDVEGGSWLLNSGLLAMAVAMPATGWLVSRFGMKRLFIATVGLFVLASLGCALSWNIAMLIFCRVTIGAVSGTMVPVCQSLCFSAHPPEKRGFAMAMFAFGSCIGIFSISVLNSYFVEQINWRIFFLLSMPFGITAMVAGLVVLRQDVDRPERAGLDLGGAVALTSCLLCLLLALSQGQRIGWDTTYIRSLLAISLGSLTAFFIKELRTDNPFVDISLYRNPNFTLVALVAMTYGLGIFGTNFLIPLFLQHVLSYSVFLTALAMLPGGFAGALMLLFSGWLTDRVDARIPIAIGLVLYGVSIYWMSTLAWETSFATVAAMLSMRMIGMAFLFPSIMKAVLGGLPPERIGMAAGLINLVRQIGGMLGIAVLGTILERREIYHKWILSQTQAFAPLGSEGCLDSMKDLYERLGNVECLAETKALLTLDRLTGRTALINAFDDCFLIASFIFFLTIIPALFVRPRRLR